MVVILIYFTELSSIGASYVKVVEVRPMLTFTILGGVLTPSAQGFSGPNAQVRPILSATKYSPKIYFSAV